MCFEIEELDAVGALFFFVLFFVFSEVRLVKLGVTEDAEHQLLIEDLRWVLALIILLLYMAMLRICPAGSPHQGVTEH